MKIWAVCEHHNTHLEMTDLWPVEPYTRDQLLDQGTYFCPRSWDVPSEHDCANTWVIDDLHPAAAAT